MEVSNSAQIVILTQNVVTVVNSNIPSVQQNAQLDRSIESRQTFDVYPEPRDAAISAPIEFVVHPVPGHYLDMSSIYIDVKLEMTEEDGTRVNIAGWRTIHFINNLSQTLWNVIKVHLNDAVIESNYNNPQIAFMQQILTTPDVLIKERGVVQGAFSITPTSHLDVFTEDSMAADDTLVTRFTYAKAQPVHLIAPLHLNVSSCSKYLLDGVTLRIGLEQAPNAFVMNDYHSQNFRCKITSVKLRMDRVKPSEGALFSTTKMAIKRPIEYLMRRNIMFTTIFPANHSEITVWRPFKGVIPERLYFFLVDQRAANGARTRNPFYYGRCHLRSYSVRINGEQIDGCEVTQSMVEMYHRSMLAHGSDYFIPFEMYSKGCFVICVNTNRGSRESSIAVEKRGNMEIKLSLS